MRAIAAAAFLLFALPAHADPLVVTSASVPATVELDDGSVIRGDVVGEVHLSTMMGTVNVPAARIRRLNVGAPPPPQATPTPEPHLFEDRTAVAPPRPVETPAEAAAPSLAGRFEVGGGVLLETFRLDESISDSSISGHGESASVQPFLGWFFDEHVEWIAAISLRHSAVDYSDNSGNSQDSYGVSFGLTYLVPIAPNAFLAPEGYLGYSGAVSDTADGTNPDFHLVEQGLTGSFGVSVRAMIGQSAFLSTSFDGYVIGHSLDASQGTAKGTGAFNENGFHVGVSASALF